MAEEMGLQYVKNRYPHDILGSLFYQKKRKTRLMEDSTRGPGFMEGKQTIVDPSLVHH